MSIFKKVIIIFSIVVAISIFTTFLILHFIILESFIELEKKSAVENVKRAAGILSDEISVLRNQNNDWASWDDSYEFINNANEEYIKSNLIDETFIILKLNLMIFLNSSGDIVYQKAFNLIDKEEVEVPPDIYKYISKDNILTKHPDTESSISGILLLKDNPILITSEPILTSENKGPIRGTLIMGRYLDDSVIDKLANIIYLSVEIFRLDDLQTQSNYKNILSVLPDKSSITVKNLNEDLAVGYIILEDIYRKPTLLLSVSTPRDIYKEGKRTEIYLMLLFSVITILIGFLIFVIINKIFLKRLINLKKTVKKIGEKKDISERINVSGNDELSILSKNINYMLKDLEDAQNNLKQGEQRYRSLFENSLDGIYISTLGGKYIDVNSALVKILGYDSREELLSINIKKQLYWSEKDRPSIKDMNKIFETSLKKKDGTRIFVEISSRVIYDKNKNLYYQGIVRDITSRKKSEEKARFLSFHDNLTGLYNRTYFEEELSRLDAERQLPLSIIIGDANGLKLINDAFGHREGDLLLCICSRILEECCRKEDIVARWGGDEFIVLLPRTSKNVANEIIGRIKINCEKNKINELPVSLSLGAATKDELNQHINSILRKAEDMMYQRKLLERKSFTNSIIASLEKVLLKKSNETKEHSQRINKLALKLGRLIKLPQNKLDEISLLSNLHDIGKVAIPDNILEKKRRLTKKERRIIKRHSEIGYNIAKSSIQFAHIAEAILSHHEHWDGTGYLQGLKRGNIPIISRIMAIVDSYDAMTHDRPYKKAISKKEAIEEIKKYTSVRYDPELVKKFIQILEEDKI